MVGYAVTIFLSAFLLFQVQPIMARYILPWYGGSPAVWTTCLLFFQTGLLAGYAYAHLLQRHFQPRRQVLIHLGLVAISLLLLPITPSEGWVLGLTDRPVLGILVLLSVTVGVPYLLIASSGPLLQHWFGQAKPTRSPYRLYALSNFGSLLGLLSYPFLVEPALPVQVQTGSWSIAYALYGLGCLWCALPLIRNERSSLPMPQALERGEPPAWGTRLLWLALAAVGTTILMAGTNQICEEVAVVPFLWVLPLGLYLGSLIICFENEHWYDRRVWLPVFFVSLAAVLYLLRYPSQEWTLIAQLAIYGGAIFACCMVCHGELARLKPPPRYLTSFYLTVAAGGAAGGLFVALVAPQIFNGLWELHLGLIGTYVLMLVCLFRSRGEAPSRLRWFGQQAAIGGGLATAILLGMNVLSYADQSQAAERNFYGVMRVYESSVDGQSVRSLWHSGTCHGEQFVAGDDRLLPVTYYGPDSGIGLALRLHPHRTAEDEGSSPLRVGLLGLGTGTATAYGRAGDTYRIYEIDPDVVRICREYFTYLDDTQATCEIVLGDGRISLARELHEQGSQQFDVLAMDAFSGDAIPVHLITREAFALYLQHLRPGGILAVNISNRHVDVMPVLLAAAEHFDLHAVLVSNEEKIQRNIWPADWVLLTRNEAFLQQREVSAWWQLTQEDPRRITWTDDYSNLLQVLK